MFEQHAQGTVLIVRAYPGARKNEIRGEQDGMLRISVSAAPEKGKANKAILELLSDSLKIRKSQIELISGETAHQKRFLFHQVSEEELREKLS